MHSKIFFYEEVTDGWLFGLNFSAMKAQSAMLTVTVHNGYSNERFTGNSIHIEAPTSFLLFEEFLAYMNGDP